MDINKISKKNPILNNLLNDYLYYKKISDSLKKCIYDELNEDFKVALIKKNKLIIFVEDNFIATKLKNILANRFEQWKKNNNYKFKGYSIKISHINKKFNL